MLTSNQKLILTGDPQAAYYELRRVQRPANFFDSMLVHVPARVARVLDAGCGSGTLTFQLAGRAECVIALDHSPAMLELGYARQKATPHTNIQWLEADLLSEPFAEASFDLILSCYVLRLTDFKTSVPQLARLCRPGGLVVLRDLFQSGPRQKRFRVWHLSTTLRTLPAFYRTYGFAMTQQFLAWRLSPAEIKSASENPRISREAFLAFYGQVFPGAKFETTGWDITMLWQKPE